MERCPLISGYRIVPEVSVINTDHWHTVCVSVEPRRKRTSDEEEQRRDEGKRVRKRCCVRSVAWRERI